MFRRTNFSHWFVTFMIVAVVFAGCRTQRLPESSTPEDSVAFVNVNVIPMDRERVLQDQTVIVQNGR